MSYAEWMALMPLIVLAGAASVVLLAAAFVRRHGLIAGLSVTGLLAFMGSLLYAAPVIPVQVTELFLVDAFALVYWVLIAGATVATTLLSHHYFQGRHSQPEEVYPLLLLGALGACALAASVHFISLFLSLELLSVCLFILVPYRCAHARPVEAGIKYLVLGGLATGFLLFGMALVYAQSGALGFGSAGTTQSGLHPVVGVTGAVLILAGLAFKLSLVPFHLWTPDVYEGAPAPISGFLATVSKGSVLAVLMRYTLSHDPEAGTALWNALAVIAGASMLAGNWLALLQDNLKRLLAYSSIAHMGYALVAVLAGGAFGAETVTVYLVFYFITNLGAFGVIALYSRASPGDEREAEGIHDLQGIFWHRPALAFVMTLMLLSLAGVPLTAGFIGKFYILAAGMRQELWTLVMLVIVGSAIGLFYYLRVILIMLQAEPRETMTGAALDRPVSGALCLAVLSALLIWVGVYPGPVLEWVAGAVQ